MLQTFNLSLNSKPNKKIPKNKLQQKEQRNVKLPPSTKLPSPPIQLQLLLQPYSNQQKNAVPALDTEKKCRKHKKDLASPDVCLCLNESE
jgi:hypothetical protein